MAQKSSATSANETLISNLEGQLDRLVEQLKDLEECKWVMVIVLQYCSVAFDERVLTWSVYAVILWFQVWFGRRWIPIDEGRDCWPNKRVHRGIGSHEQRRHNTDQHILVDATGECRGRHAMTMLTIIIPIVSLFMWIGHPKSNRKFIQHRRNDSNVWRSEYQRFGTATLRSGRRIPIEKIDAEWIWKFKGKNRSVICCMNRSPSKCGTLYLSLSLLTDAIAVSIGKTWSLPVGRR